MIGPLTDPRAHGTDPSIASDLVIPSLPGFERDDKNLVQWNMHPEPGGHYSAHLEPDVLAEDICGSYRQFRQARQGTTDGGCRAAMRLSLRVK